MVSDNHNSFYFIIFYNKFYFREDDYMEQISAFDINKYIYDKNVIIIDIRNSNSYNRYHIPGAINISMNDIENGRYHLDRSKKIITYCDRGGQGIIACKILEERGYKMGNIVGGMNALKNIDIKSSWL